MTQNNTGGGNATASGITFQENVGLFFVVSILAETNLLAWHELNAIKYLSFFAENK